MSESVDIPYLPRSSEPAPSIIVSAHHQPTEETRTAFYGLLGPDAPPLNPQAPVQGPAKNPHGKEEERREERKDRVDQIVDRRHKKDRKLGRRT